MEPWAWAIVITVGLSILGAFWALVRKGNERTESRLDEHIKEDVKVHERVAVVESKVEGLQKMMDGEHGVIKRLHAHGTNITKILGRLFKEDIGK